MALSCIPIKALIVKHTWTIGHCTYLHILLPLPIDAFLRAYITRIFLMHIAAVAAYPITHIHVYLRIPVSKLVNLQLLT
jgi:hypothetical protein